MLFDYCRAQADVVASQHAPMDLSMFGNGPAKGQRRQADAVAERRARTKAGGKDDKKGKASGNVTECFAGYCIWCGACGHVKKDCWWNELHKSGKDASLESPSSAASQRDSTIAGMLPQSDGCSTAVDATKWMFSVTNRESNRILGRVLSGHISLPTECG